jgi:hypothetical protein
MNMKLLFFILTLIILFYSCKKDKDETEPLISIASPTNLQNIFGFDTIQITGLITDDRNIESVRVSLVDLNGIPVLSTITKTPNTANFTLNVSYFFDDIQLPSGTYNFNISAYDGENTSRVYIPITYGEVSRTRESIILYSNIGNITNVYKLNNAFSSTIFHNSVSGDFMKGSVNSYDQQILSIGSYTGNLTSFDATTNNIVWDVTAVTSSFPYFTGSFLNSRDVYVSLYNGNINAYGNNGVQKFSAQAQTNFFGETGLIHENVFVSEQKAIAGNSVRLIVYWTASGTQKQQLTIDQDVVNMYTYSTNEIVLFTNELVTSDPKIIIYNLLNNNILTFSDFPSVNLNSNIIEDCLEISNGVYLILQNGVITRIDIPGISSSNYLSVAGATKMEYDYLTNELFVVSGSTVFVYDYSSLILKGSYNHTSPILDVDFLYNK